MELQTLIDRAKYLYYGCVLSKDEAVRQSIRELGIAYINLRDLYTEYDITLEEYIRSEI